MGWKKLQELETPEGILASARNEVFGCIFGRDSLISSLGLMMLYENTQNSYFLTLTEKILRTLSRLQGSELEIESGEEPGKIIHEFRPQNHSHLTQSLEEPWFVYPSGEMRSYDSVDSTPLFLMAAHAYLEVGGSSEFIKSIMPNIRKALYWLLDAADNNSDGFVDYWIHPRRQFGGLRVQNWMDSTESLFFEEELAGEAKPTYPIAPVEVQGYTWVAYRSWGEYLSSAASAADRALGARLLARAERLKQKFNESFVLKTSAQQQFSGIAFALDGEGRQLISPRSSMGHLLWASRQGESILHTEYIEPLRKRLLARDLFVPQAGIRTLSSESRNYDPVSYHNGSIWPHDTAMLALGLENFGYHEDAARVREALLMAYTHFETPIELFGYSHGFREYKSACRTQAWSTVALLSVLHKEMGWRLLLPQWFIEAESSLR
ncbi:MAG: Amylo-alpha6-glucosidase [Parcubacteria group bacterium]|nr:Amylo-alpha6-glucosidase [Parcubacteria group bacterium]